MKKSLPILLSLLFFVGYIGSKARLPKDNAKGKAAKFLTEYRAQELKALPQVYAFSELPVLYTGRIKPFDTIARNTLRVLSDREDVEFEYKPEGEESLRKVLVPQAVWILDVLSNHLRS